MSRSAPLAGQHRAHATPFPRRISALCAAAGRSFGGPEGAPRTTRCSVRALNPLSIISGGARKSLIRRGERELTSHNLYFVKSRCTAPFLETPGGSIGRTGAGFEDTDASATPIPPRHSLGEFGRVDTPEGGLR